MNEFLKSRVFLNAFYPGLFILVYSMTTIEITICMIAGFYFGDKSYLEYKKEDNNNHKQVL